MVVALVGGDFEWCDSGGVPAAGVGRAGGPRGQHDAALRFYPRSRLVDRALARARLPRRGVTGGRGMASPDRRLRISRGPLSLRRAWSKLLADYDLTRGRIWILMRIVTALTPPVAYRLKRCVAPTRTRAAAGSAGLPAAYREAGRAADFRFAGWVSFSAGTMTTGHLARIRTPCVVLPTRRS